MVIMFSIFRVYNIIANQWNLLILSYRSGCVA